MVPNITIHCDCRTDIETQPSDSTVTCPDCETTYTVTVIELPSNYDYDHDDDHDASSTHNGTRAYLGP